MREEKEREIVRRQINNLKDLSLSLSFSLSVSLSLSLSVIWLNIIGTKVNEHFLTFPACRCLPNIKPCLLTVF